MGTDRGHTIPHSQKQSASGGTFLFVKDDVSEMYHESAVMFSYGTNERIFQAKKVQIPYILLAHLYLYF